MNGLDKQIKLPNPAGAYAPELVPSPTGTNELKISHQAFPQGATRPPGFLKGHVRQTCVPRVPDHGDLPDSDSWGPKTKNAFHK